MTTLRPSLAPLASSTATPLDKGHSVREVAKRVMNRARSGAVSCAMLASIPACGSSPDMPAAGTTGTSTGRPTATDVSTGQEAATSGTTSSATDTEAMSSASETSGGLPDATTSGFDSGSTGPTGSSTEDETSETSGDAGNNSCADAASVVYAWGGRAATLGELDDPILIPGWFPASSVVVALAPFALSCDEIGEYPCGQLGDPAPHETTLIFLPEGQEPGTYDVEGPPGSSAPSVLEASTSGSPPACSAGGSGFGWEPGILELTTNDEESVAGVFCRTLSDGTTAAWTFDVNRC